MYSQLIVLILVLLIASGIFTVELHAPFLSPESALIIAFIGYVLLLALIVLQNKINRSSGKKNRRLIFTQIELIFFLALVQLIYAPRPAFDPPLLKNFFSAVGILSLYFGGLLLHYISSSYAQTPIKVKNAWKQTRFLIPFAIPFLILTLFEDILLSTSFDQSFFPSDNQSYIITLVMTVSTVIFLFAVMAFLPYFIQLFWGCKNLPQSPLKDRLEELCKKAKFNHGGMKTWPIMKESMTAAIIGILAPFRYVMFTEGLLSNLSEDEIEAVLSHEIAHSHYKHLWFYPFLLLGIGLSAGLIQIVFGPTIDNFSQQYPQNDLWTIIQATMLFLFYIVLILVYFRVVFGFYSRNFERQADGFIFSLGSNPKNMIHALDRIGTLSGNIHNVPSWHHYSIRQRIEYLQEAIRNPSLIKRHNRKVLIIEILYLALFLAAISALIFL